MITDKKHCKLFVSFKPIMQFDVLLNLQSLEPYLPTLSYEKGQYFDPLAIIDNYNFCDMHTYKRTWRLYDQPNQEGHVAENFYT